MLFVESRTLNYPLDGATRVLLLEKLQEKELTPLIRSARLNCFEHALLGPERVREMESALATWSESELQEPYTRGELFFFNDHIFFLIFDGGEPAGIRAGIIYETQTPEPFRKLDSFCREVRESLLTARSEIQTAEAARVQEVAEWQQGRPAVPVGFKRFVAKQDIDSLYTSLRKETVGERIRAAELLEDADARIFLRRAKEAHVEGYAAKLLPGDSVGSYEFSVDRLADAGLLRREVQVTCRKTGHALFRLPSADALAVVTVSNAMCSECGSAVADERVEEVVAPTRLAASLLEDGSWLISRLHFVLRDLGIPESEIAIGPSEGDGHGQMMANVCGESFLLIARDGDLTPAFARRAIDTEIETEASHLVIVATGRIHNEARVLLHDHARRRVLAGDDFELILTEGAAAAGRELQYAFERVSQRVVAEQVCALDSSIGLSVSRMIITKFQVPPRDQESDRRRLSGNADTGFSQIQRPLSLAAHAASGAIDVRHDQFVADEATDAIRSDGTDSVGTTINSGTHG